MSPALIFVVSCLLSIVTAVPGNFCRTSAQCGCNECCAINSMMVSKRQELSKSAIPVEGSSARIIGGTCQTYLSEGAPCSPFGNGCGCGAGLICQENINIMSRQVNDQAMIVAPGTGKGLFYTCTRQFYRG